MFHGFIGEYHHSIDAKNRVMVPAKFRDAFAETQQEPRFYLTRGPDHCLMMFTPEQWEHLEKTLDAVTDVKNLKGSVRHFHRAIYTNAHYCACDKLGRIVIPQTLVDHAGLRQEVVIAGVKHRMEIWSEDKWKEYQDRILEDFENLTEDIYQP